ASASKSIASTFSSTRRTSHSEGVRAAIVARPIGGLTARRDVMTWRKTQENAQKPSGSRGLTRRRRIGPPSYAVCEECPRLRDKQYQALRHGHKQRGSRPPLPGSAAPAGDTDRSGRVNPRTAASARRLPSWRPAPPASD